MVTKRIGTEGRREATALDRENLGFRLAKASQRWNELLAERFRRDGFPEVRPSYGSILVPLFEEDGLRMGLLAERAGLSKQTMTTMVRLLERDGLVTRTRDPDDGRAWRVSLTRRSHAFRPVAERALEELHALVGERLGADEVARFQRFLEEVQSL
ncbi:MAG TPA: MarR family transcriptional regulator [Thermoleophilaceae bacterium]|jgi:DNA-binding MarR family transcriptional regulator